MYIMLLRMLENNLAFRNFSQSIYLNSLSFTLVIAFYNANANSHVSDENNFL